MMNVGYSKILDSWDPTFFNIKRLASARVFLAFLCCLCSGHVQVTFLVSVTDKLNH